MHRQALAVLDSTRPALARLDRSRNSVERALDIQEAWAGVEAALRVVLGASPLSGQQLIHEARQRQMITYEQANALADFHAARSRTDDKAYQATDADINAAREGFLKFEKSLLSPASGASVPTPGEAMSTKGLRLSPLGMPRPVNLPPERQPWWFAVLAIAVVAGLAFAGWYFFMRRDGGPLEVGVRYWQEGRRELATSEFERVLRADPANAMAHVYLSRLAREGGNLPLAREHATQAVQADGRSVAALRELGSTLLAAGDNELARRFYVRALEVAPDDRASQGFLGCALLRLGRTDEGTRWLNRAGQGSWSVCSQTAQAPR